MKNMYSSWKNIMDFYKEIYGMGKSFDEIRLVIGRVLVIPVSLALTMRRIKTYLRGQL